MIDEELLLIKGGAVMSVTVVNALVRMVNASLELGRTLGSVIRRATDKTTC